MRLVLWLVLIAGCGSPSATPDGATSADLRNSGMPTGAPCTKAFDCAPSSSGCQLCTYSSACGGGMVSACNLTCTVSLNDCPSGLTCTPLSSPGYGAFQSGSCGDGFCYPITC